MAGETAPSGEQHLGEHYLELLGLGHRADEQLPGRPQRARDFLEICGEHALPALMVLEQMDPADPDYEPTLAALRGSVEQFLAPEAPAEG